MTPKQQIEQLSLEPHYAEAMKTGGWRVLRKRNTLRVALFNDTGADEVLAKRFAAEMSGEKIGTLRESLLTFLGSNPSPWACCR